MALISQKQVTRFREKIREDGMVDVGLMSRNRLRAQLHDMRTLTMIATVAD